jgi:hypothetical protein
VAGCTEDWIGEARGGGGERRRKKKKKKTQMTTAPDSRFGEKEKKKKKEKKNSKRDTPTPPPCQIYFGLTQCFKIILKCACLDGTTPTSRKLIEFVPKKS